MALKFQPEPRFVVVREDVLAKGQHLNDFPIGFWNEFDQPFRGEAHQPPDNVG